MNRVIVRDTLKEENCCFFTYGYKFDDKRSVKDTNKHVCWVKKNFLIEKFRFKQHFWFKLLNVCLLLCVEGFLSFLLSIVGCDEGTFVGKRLK